MIKVLDGVGAARVHIHYCEHVQYMHNNQASACCGRGGPTFSD